MSLSLSLCLSCVTIYYINLLVALQWWILVQLHQRPISWTKVTWRIPLLTQRRTKICLPKSNGFSLPQYWLDNATAHTWKCWRSCQTTQNLHCARFCSESEWINESKCVCFCSKLNVFFTNFPVSKSCKNRIDKKEFQKLVQFVSDLLHKLDKMATFRSKSNPSNTCRPLVDFSMLSWIKYLLAFQWSRCS